MGDACSARTTTARHSRFLRPFSSKRLLRRRADDAVGNFETENQVFLQKAQAVHQARVQEDDVWQKSQVDPVVKQLEAADKQQDAYMTAFRYINDGYAALTPTARRRRRTHWWWSTRSRTSSFSSTTATMHEE